MTRRDRVVRAGPPEALSACRESYASSEGNHAPRNRIETLRRIARSAVGALPARLEVTFRNVHLRAQPFLLDVSETTVGLDLLDRCVNGIQ